MGNKMYPFYSRKASSNAKRQERQHMLTFMNYREAGVFPSLHYGQSVALIGSLNIRSPEAGIAAITF